MSYNIVNNISRSYSSPQENVHHKNICDTELSQAFLYFKLILVSTLCLLMNKSTYNFEIYLFKPSSNTHKVISGIYFLYDLYYIRYIWMKNEDDLKGTHKEK